MHDRELAKACSHWSIRLDPDAVRWADRLKCELLPTQMTVVG